MLKALTQYQEATGDTRVVPLMTRYFRHHLENADRRPLQIVHMLADGFGR
jgi:hypothetical protein